MLGKSKDKIYKDIVNGGKKLQIMTIRKGIAEDMPSALKLIKELALFEKEPEAVVISAEDLIRDGFGNQPLFQTFVAENEGEIIGLALFYYRYSTWKGKTIHLEDLIVTENYRGKGIGIELYKKVLEQGYNEGVNRMEWNVLSWNTPAIDFYEKSGALVLDDWRVAQIDKQGIRNFIENNL